MVVLIRALTFFSDKSIALYVINLQVSIVRGKEFKRFPINPKNRCTRVDAKTLGSAKLSTKGQVTIPVAARNKFKLEIGDLILFLEEDGKLVLRKG